MLRIMLEVLRSCCTISTWSNKPFPCSFFLLHIIPGLEFHLSIHVLGVLKPCKGCSRSRLPCNWMLCVSPSPSTSFHLLPPKHKPNSSKHYVTRWPMTGAHGVVAGFIWKTRSHFQVHRVYGSVSLQLKRGRDGATIRAYRWQQLFLT